MADGLLSGLVSGFGREWGRQQDIKSDEERRRREATINLLADTLHREDVTPEGREAALGMLGQVLDPKGKQGTVNMLTAMEKLMQQEPTFMEEPLEKRQTPLGKTIPYSQSNPLVQPGQIQTGKRRKFFRSPLEMRMEEARALQGLESEQARRQFEQRRQAILNAPLSDWQKQQLMMREIAGAYPPTPPSPELEKVVGQGGRPVFTTKEQAVGQEAYVPGEKLSGPSKQYQELTNYYAGVLGIPADEAHKRAVSEIEESIQAERKADEALARGRQLMNQIRQKNLAKDDRVNPSTALRAYSEAERSARIRTDEWEKRITTNPPYEVPEPGERDRMFQQFFTEALQRMGADREMLESIIGTTLREQAYSDEAVEASGSTYERWKQRNR